MASDSEVYLPSHSESESTHHDDHYHEHHHDDHYHDDDHYYYDDHQDHHHDDHYYEPEYYHHDDHHDFNHGSLIDYDLGSYGLDLDLSKYADVAPINYDYDPFASFDTYTSGFGHYWAQTEDKYGYGHVTADSSDDEVIYTVTDYVQEEYQVAKKVPVVETK